MLLKVIHMFFVPKVRCKMVTIILISHTGSLRVLRFSFGIVCDSLCKC